MFVLEHHAPSLTPHFKSLVYMQYRELIIILTALVFMPLVACEQNTPSSGTSTSQHTTADESQASQNSSAASICSSWQEFQSEGSACCWKGQTMSNGSCQGTPTQCPEPLLLFPPSNRCDPCAGAPSCTEALKDCKEGGQACFVAATKYASNSNGLKEDLLRSTSLFLEACNQGHLVACNNAAIHFEQGVGVSFDLDRALELFKKSCPEKEKEAPGCKNLARIYQYQGKSKLAVNLLESRCDAFSQPHECSALLNLRVGESMASGQEPDFNALLKLANKSCSDDFQKGCTQLATLLISQQGSKASAPVQAVDLLEKACAAEEPSACVELATLYQKGLTRAGKDDSKAFELYEKACKLNQINACGSLSLYYLRPNLPAAEPVSAQVRRQRAVQLGQLACSRAEMTGCQTLAMLSSGQDQAATQALTQIRQQAGIACDNHKVPSMCSLLGELEIRGLGGERNLQQGLKRLDDACKRGVVGACQRRTQFKK